MTQGSINSSQLDLLSDEDLWAIVSKQEKLLLSDQSEFEASIEAYDQFVLLRSQALVILKQRGHNVERWLKSTNRQFNLHSR